MSQPLEGQGAFVDIDQTKLSRDGLVLLGMSMAMEQAMNDLTTGAVAQTNPVNAQLLMQVAERYNQRLSAIQVQLTKSATKSGAGVVNTFKKD
ncbi:MAG: hypothetical protein Q7T86_03165 [Hyphomicrobiaceae bacterium]|nr:hypothetical protein [Hyphomicrobiaceae bacterium]